ncbi:nitroreductase [Psychrobacter luti]|uniref:Putative NAD(P)H nitroreductase n=1 Tax=Psychrobacter luti TaxID=198481 RepID=A0A839TC33_9GAMM|nr:nitroreductase [Psychrobacter luti]MBB3105625.1 nitroreductase [Psychrobacter luti]
MSNSADSLEENNDNSDEPFYKSAPQNNTESPIVTNAQVTDEQLINWIKSRRSIGNLSIPAPTESQIKAAIDCAVTAPDHKKLQPWRFIVTQGNARHDLGRAFLAAAEAQAAKEGEALSEKTRQKTYNMPLRAPVIITVVTQMQVHKKVPPFEQMLSTGAAVQNLILALKAQGFSTVWRTGLLCNEPAVKEYFGVGTDDYVTAFVYTGSSPCDMPTRKPIDIEPLLRFES